MKLMEYFYQKKRIYNEWLDYQYILRINGINEIKKTRSGLHRTDYFYPYSNGGVLNAMVINSSGFKL